MQWESLFTFTVFFPKFLIPVQSWDNNRQTQIKDFFLPLNRKSWTRVVLIIGSMATLSLIIAECEFDLSIQKHFYVLWSLMWICESQLTTAVFPPSAPSSGIYEEEGGIASHWHHTHSSLFQVISIKWCFPSFSYSCLIFMLIFYIYYVLLNIFL